MTLVIFLEPFINIVFLTPFIMVKFSPILITKPIIFDYSFRDHSWRLILLIIVYFIIFSSKEKVNSSFYLFHFRILTPNEEIGMSHNW